MAYHIWINGKHTAGTSGKVIEVRNPTTEEIAETIMCEETFGPLWWYLYGKK